MTETMIAQPHGLAVGPIGRDGLGWWGIWTLIAGEAALFAYLLFCYYYSAATASPGWLLDPRPKLWPGLPATGLLLASSGVVAYAEKQLLRKRNGRALIGLGAAFVMGLGFTVIQVFEWAGRAFGPSRNSYASLYFVTTGLHLAHVVIGLGILLALFAWIARHLFSPRASLTVSAGILYWHFVDIVWLFVFATYYLTPYLGFGR